MLARVRREQGFTSAHQFFKRVGGSKSLGLAYVSYWDMERGKKLPRSWRLKAIMAALGVAPHSARAQDLVKAYFTSLSGSEELLQFLSGPAKEAPDLPSRELVETATRRMLEQLSVNLTLEQWKLCTRDMVTDICQTYLNETAGWVTAAELVKATRFKMPAVKKALKALADGDIVDLSGDKARGRHVGKTIQLLPLTPATAGIRAALRNNCNAWLAESRLVAMKRVSLRMTKANLDQYLQHLENAVKLATVYGGVNEDRRESAIYFVDAKVYKYLPKD